MKLRKDLKVALAQYGAANRRIGKSHKASQAARLKRANAVAKILEIFDAIARGGEGGEP